MAPLSRGRSAATRRTLALLAVTVLGAGCARLAAADWFGLAGSKREVAADGVTQSTPLVVGRVVDAAGSPVAGAKVKVYEGLSTPLDGTTQSTPLDGSRPEVPTEARMTTGEQGEFAVRAPDRRVLAVEAWDWRHNRAARLGIAVDPRSARIDVGIMRLAPEAAATGRVRTPAGVSPEGTAVFVPGTDHVTRADATGAYRLEELPAGETRIAAVRPKFRPAVAAGLSLLGGQTTVVPDLVLEPERLVLSSVAPHCAGPGAEVVLTGEGFGHTALRPVDVRFNRLKASGVTRVSDTELRAVVPPGAQSGPVDVVVEGHTSPAVPFAVVASVSVEPGAIRLPTSETSRFRVVAQDAAGREIPAADLAWTVEPGDLGTLDAAQGTFKARRHGFGTLTVTTGRIKAQASLGFGDWQVETLIGTTATTDARPGPVEGPAAAVQFWFPTALAVHPDGRLLFGNITPYPGAGTHNTAAPWIRSLDSQGTVRLVAGTSVIGYDGDGLGPLASRFGFVRNLAVAPGKGLVVVDWGETRRVRVVPERDGPWLGRSLLAGFLYDVLGNGEPGPKGYGRGGLAGLPPLETSILQPSAIAWDPAGKLVVASMYSESAQMAGRILELSEDGSVTAIVDSIAKERVFGGDRADPLAFPDIPYSILVDPVGNLLVGTNSHVWLLCRKAGTYYGVRAESGDLVVVAGTGDFTTRQQEFSGEEIPARSARVWNVTGLTILAGRLVLADSGFNRVREIDADGRIRTIAGGGTSFDGLALQTGFVSPNHLAAGPDGSLFLADSTRIVRLRR